jgi:hypothetical protein
MELSHPGTCCPFYNQKAISSKATLPMPQSRFSEIMTICMSKMDALSLQTHRPGVIIVPQTVLAAETAEAADMQYSLITTSQIVDECS